MLPTLQTTVVKRCGQMLTVRNKCRKMQTNLGKYGQTADMREWKNFDIERLCLVNFSYICIVFTLFSVARKDKRHIVDTKVCTCTFQEDSKVRINCLK